MPLNLETRLMQVNDYRLPVHTSIVGTSTSTVQVAATTGYQYTSNITATFSYKSTIAKNIFSQLIESKMDVDELIKEQGLEQISDTTEIEQIVITVLKEHQEQKDQYLAGKEQVLGFLIGKVMQKTQGKANPKLVNDLMVKILSNN